MGYLIAAIIIFFIIRSFSSSSNNSSPSNHNLRNNHTNSRGGSAPRSNSRPPPSGNAYRPSGNSRNPINFTTINTGSGGNFTEKQIEGLQDAYSGEKLSLSKGIIQCNSCKVFYHRSSFLVLQQENSSNCVSCSSRLVDLKYEGRTTSNGVNFNPTTVNLLNYQSYVGRVVTFQGEVVAIRESRRGGDYALMFEDKSWRWGFKLVFFGGSIASCGGEDFIKSLENKLITVRGLIVKHRKFGYEIIISERSMILGVN